MQYSRIVQPIQQAFAFDSCPECGSKAAVNRFGDEECPECGDCIVVCQACGQRQLGDWMDIAGACAFNGFCCECNTEINLTSGEVHEPCKQCEEVLQ